MIALMMDADIFINLTDIDGLHTKDPRRFSDAELISRVCTISKATEKFASDIAGALGTGGMLSKIKAANKVTSAGIPMVIANGLRPNILTKLFAGQTPGTYFVPKAQRLASRKSWIAFSLKPQGAITIDDGAAVAIVKNGKSLLPGGIVSVDDDFGVGAPVEFKDLNDDILGLGLVNYSAAEIRRIKGLKSNQIKGILGHKSYDEVIHRDNLALFD
jgi:glutamate 5-kinase